MWTYVCRLLAVRIEGLGLPNQHEEPYSQCCSAPAIHLSSQKTRKDCILISCCSTARSVRLWRSMRWSHPCHRLAMDMICCSIKQGGFPVRWWSSGTPAGKMLGAEQRSHVGLNFLRPKSWQCAVWTLNGGEWLVMLTGENTSPLRRTKR